MPKYLLGGQCFANVTKWESIRMLLSIKVSTVNLELDSKLCTETLPSG